MSDRRGRAPAARPAASRRKRPSLGATPAAILLGLVTLVAVIFLRVLDPPLVQQVRNAVFDSYQRLLPRAYEPAPVRIVAIDEEALQLVGQWPWSRADLAQLVSAIAAQGPASIGLAVLLAEPDRVAGVPLAQRGATRVQEMPDVARAISTTDAELARVIREAPVVASFALDPSGRDRSVQPKWGLVMRTGQGEQPSPPSLPSFAGAVTALPGFQAAAKGNGFLNITRDADGVERRASLFLDLAGTPVPSLAAEMLRVAQGASSYIALTNAGQVEEVRNGDLVTQTGADADIWLHMSGSRPERFVSAAAVLRGEVAPELLAGNLVIVGSTAQGLRDLHPTAVSPAMLGVELQAEFLEQLILGGALVRPDWAGGAELLYILVLGLGLVALLARLPPMHGAIIGAGATANALGVSLFLFARYGILVDAVAPSLSLLAVYLAVAGTSYIRAERERRFVRHAFERYLAPAVVERLVERRDSLVFGGETRTVTLMFCDVRGFTTISERLDAQGVTRFVNGFMTPVTGAILTAGGTVVSFMGDGIMAFWNAPLDDPEHERHACEAALAMMARLPAIDTALREAHLIAPDLPPLGIGIGVNTGDCAVGNMGSEQRFDYSAIGDPVNLASRLEGLSKQYGVPIILGDATAAAVPDLAIVELDLIKVKGKQRPERIHGLLGDADLARTEHFKRLADAQARLLNAVRSRDTATASSLIDSWDVHDPEDRLARSRDLWAARIRALEAMPPGPDWDGVFTATSK